ncbi:hypothetical protein SAMD00019534_119170 [Acytostelium subglobosum LB1]|uniref:hypothetical protein n=1 Tax=Acytostelium subglobosum LB1 TaxID=1410327 RepID=UPI0006451D92|nr:hypothetical protein SAMD00019534_119170 [Acytostelium subglobosum LB1]GAM28741.1 hypothetical protein SAMD00019534_119170 [Acytostelium subglobosum LB1]|eukprot:XP_012748296.1 hypothetical protein SAMD00019534_119170 [Acytostelium subglobosum LB1]
MDSLKPIPTSLAPEVLELVKQYYDGDIASQQLYNELKKVFKRHSERQNWMDSIYNEVKGMKKGSGRKHGGLYDYEIDKLMQPYANDGFEGVIASDQLDELKPKQHMSFIMNLDKSSQPGSHWVACYIDAKGDKSIEYYDSFGDDPSTDFMRRMKQLIEEIDPDVYLKFKVNRVIDQAVNTDTCGYHAMRFLLNRYRGVPFKEATGYSDVRREEKKAREMKERYKRFGYL